MQSNDNSCKEEVTLIDPILTSIEQAIGDRRVGVDSAVAEEGPVAADVFEGLQVDVADQDFFAVVRGFGEDSSEGVAEKRCAPEFQSVAGGGLAADVAGFEAYAVDYCYVDSVGDGVGALNGAPGVVLGCAELGFLGGMPADRCGIEEDRRALQRGEAGAFGKPLVPAD